MLKKYIIKKQKKWNLQLKSYKDECVCNNERDCNTCSNCNWCIRFFNRFINRRHSRNVVSGTCVPSSKFTSENCPYSFGKSQSTKKKVTNVFPFFSPDLNKQHT